MNSEQIKQFVDDFWDDEVVPTLSDYIEIPAKSPAFDADWEKHGYIRRAVDHFQRAAARIPVKGAKSKIVTLPGRTPVLCIDVPATGACAGEILFYGHYDKQPEFDGWANHLGPWLPVIQDNRLYGRGGADDGYAMFAALGSIAALDAQGIPHPRCFVLIEGCEESGSFDLPFYLDHLKKEIGEPDLLICLDAECGNYEQLWLTTSLRGMISGTLRVDVLTEGVHSGMAGGIVPSSFRILRTRLEQVENSLTGDMLAELYGEIPTHVHAEATLAAQTLDQEVIAKFPWHGSTRPVTADIAELILRGTWHPSLATVGLGGAPDPSSAGNTLRPFTTAKLAFRLPPNVNARHAAETVTAAFKDSPPQGATVQFKVEAAESGWYAKPLQPQLMKSLNQASSTYFGQAMRQVGCGGTIPFMAMLAEKFPDCQCVVTGVLGPHSNAHGPNEFLDIPTGKKVTACMSSVIADFAEITKELD